MNIDATTGAEFATKTRVPTVSGKITIKFTAPGQPPITMTGKDLTMIPRW